MTDTGKTYKVKPTQSEVKERNLETYGANVRKFRIRAGISSDKLGDLLGIARSSVRNWESGVTRPDPEYLYRMFTLLDVEPNEFFGFKGVGTVLTEKERELLHNYRALDEAGKEDAGIMIEFLLNRTNERRMRKCFAQIGTVDTMSRLVAAGDGADWEEHPEKEKILLYATEAVRKADEIFIVNGDSMEPQFSSGDRVLVEYCESDDLRFGDIGIFYVPGFGGVIKQKAYDRLHSLNPKFDDIFPYEDGAQVIGRVLGKVTKDMIPSPEDEVLYKEACTVLGAIE